jgi:hypothetical protein
MSKRQKAMVVLFTFLVTISLAFAIIVEASVRQP